MRLLYLFPEPLPLPRARGVQVAHTVIELARLGHGVELAHVPSGLLHPLHYYGLESVPGVVLTPISRSLYWPLQGVHSNRFFLWRLERHLSKSTWDIVFSRHLKLSAMLLQRHAGLRLAYEAHEVFSDTAAPNRRARQAAMEAYVMAHATFVIANSDATAYRLREVYGRQNIAVIGNGVDRPAALPAKDWANPGGHIVYAGSFYPWKGVEDLVEAAGMLPGCCVTLLGGQSGQVGDRGQAAGDQGAKLQFGGHVPHSEVALALQAATIAVLPNRDGPDSRFTSPIKLFEYMAAGCAVVASDLPALRSVLAEDEAVWVRPGDPVSLAAGIRRLVADPALAQCLGAKAWHQSLKHTWSARAQRLESLLVGR